MKKQKKLKLKDYIHFHIAQKCVLEEGFNLNEWLETNIK